MIFNPSNNDILQTVSTHPEGRWTFSEIKSGSLHALIVCVYAPNEHQPRTELLEDLKSALETMNPKRLPIILGGDWNFVEDPILDRYNSPANRDSASAAAIQEVCEMFNLVDIWRYRNPSNPALHGTNLLSARIDRFYVSRSLEPLIKEVKPLPCTLSDHLPLMITLREDIKVGKGR